MNPFKKGKFRQFVIITLLGITIGFLLCPTCYLDTKSFLENWKNLVISVIYTYVLGYGCSFISDKIACKYYQGRNPVKAFIISLVALALYSFIASMILWYFAIRILYNPDFSPTASELIANAQLPMYIALGISMFFSGVEFLKNWKNEAVKAERLEKEQIATQYESLRNQVNPHFLFNSLNTLTSLVYDNQDLAVKYIHQLSQVYRYVLDSRNKDLIPLEEELNFLESYLFLQKIRFGENLKVETNFTDEKNKFVLPLSLQILMENAVKHNEVSSEKPLKIRMFENQNYYVVENELNPKHLYEKGMGIGLSNIKERYRLLSNKDIIIEKDEHTFRVKLPIIEEVK